MKLSGVVAVWIASFFLGCTHIHGSVGVRFQLGRTRSQSKVVETKEASYITKEEFDQFSSALSSHVDSVLQHLQKLEAKNNKDNCEGSPCTNQGTCRNRLNGYDCLCKPGYGGANCEHVEGLGISKILQVDNGMYFGSWHPLTAICPTESFATSFRIQLEDPIDGDDTAMNNIHLSCRHVIEGTYTTISSGSGPFGSWRDWQNCPDGEFLTGFSLKVEGDQGGSSDDTAANGITMTCSGGSKLTGPSGPWGSYGSTASCPENHAICGVRTRIEGDQGSSSDDTSLNDVIMICCAWW